MSAPTLKELVARATPGPWVVFVKESPNGGDMPPKVCHESLHGFVAQMGYGNPVGATDRRANAQLIARIASPEVAERIYSEVWHAKVDAENYLAWAENIEAGTPSYMEELPKRLARILALLDAKTL